MLKRLSVKNIAIIEDLTIDFSSGMTVLCGETGAGKSLIIDSISLLLGARADSDMIRYGESKAYIEGIFTYDNPKINEILKSNGINVNDNITIYREMSMNGRNIIKVNEANVTVQLLKNIALYLADIHVQHDTFRLINPDTYLSFLDNPDKEDFINAMNDYILKMTKYKEALSLLNDLKNRHKASAERLEFLVYERDELEALDLYEGKDDKLNEDISKLLNHDKIFRSLNEAYQNLESEYFSLDNIYNAYKALDDISEYDSEYNSNKDIVFDAYSNLTEVKSALYKAIDSLDYDEDELNNLQEELHKIEEVKAKYKKSIPELISELENIKLEISLNEEYDSLIEEKMKELTKLYDLAYDSGLKLHKIREANAKIIEKSIVSECKDLDLSDCRFEIIFNKIEKKDVLDSTIFLPNGLDMVDFMISLNKGEPLKPLHKTASGGELSRIMLAFKSYFAKVENLSLMVFDEIDTGVSGNAAMQIGKKIRNISEYSQVLCITHLPAVAAMADTQLMISKSYEGGRTTTKIQLLDFDSRVVELAKMIGGSTLSSYFIEVAKEMLKK